MANYIPIIRNYYFPRSGNSSVALALKFWSKWTYYGNIRPSSM